MTLVYKLSPENIDLERNKLRMAQVVRLFDEALGPLYKVGASK